MNPLDGHVLPAPPVNFSSQRDIDHFIKSDGSRLRPGILQGTDTLKRILSEEEIHQGDYGRYKESQSLLKDLKSELNRRLGKFEGT